MPGSNKRIWCRAGIRYQSKARAIEPSVGNPIKYSEYYGFDQRRKGMWGILVRTTRPTKKPAQGRLKDIAGRSALTYRKCASDRIGKVLYRTEFVPVSGKPQNVNCAARPEKIKPAAFWTAPLNEFKVKY